MDWWFLLRWPVAVAVGVVVATLLTVRNRTSRPVAPSPEVRLVVVISVGLVGFVWLASSTLPFATYLRVEMRSLDYLAFVAPLLGSTVGLLSIALGVLAPSSHSEGQASLAPRSILDNTRSAVGGLSVAGWAASVALLVTTGLTASADRAGQSRIFLVDYGAMQFGWGDYPGWYFGIPSFIGLATVAALAGLILVASARRTPPVEAFASYVAGRRALDRTVMLIAAAGSFGVIARALRDMGIGFQGHSNFGLPDGTLVNLEGIQPAIGTILLVASDGSTIVAVTALLLAVLQASPIGYRRSP